MNHHYPDNYHGYGHNASGMGYSGAYGDPTSMGRMGHPREGYQMPHYSLMQQTGGVYGQGGFVGQQSGNPYSMGGYSSYGIPGMNQQMVMGNRQGDMARMSGGSMVNPYFVTGMPSDPHVSPHRGGMSNQPTGYSHSQPNLHMQPQPPHMDMMSSQSHQSMPSQAVQPPMAAHRQGGRLPHGAGHSMPLQNSSSYRDQSSPHMLPRAHHVPQHPMRHPSTQQNPQEVADNILQMASSYPSNQTVQVPLKSRPAPYHIPRSPHYSMSHSDHAHTSPNSHHQTQPSPAASCQASPSPSSSSSVKSPTPVLAPIPNPIPSPGISGLRSPCNQGISPCCTQRSPAHMGSIYSGHSQGTQCGGEGPPLHHSMPQTDTQHYSPCSMTPTHNFPLFSVSPTKQRSSSVYSPSCDPCSISNQDRLHQSTYSSPSSSSPCSNNLSSYISTSKFNMGQSASSHNPVPSMHMSNNPLMSLQKLVMLPETQVVDPKSVVNDTCLSSQHDESPKNVNGPAEWLVESSGYSVGFQNQPSSLRSPQGHRSQSQHCVLTNDGTSISANSLGAGNRDQKQSSCGIDSSLIDSSTRKLHQGSNSDGVHFQQNINDNSVAKTIGQSANDLNHQNIHAASNHRDNLQQSQGKLKSTVDSSNCGISDEDESCSPRDIDEINRQEQAVVKSITHSLLAEAESADRKALSEESSEVDNQGSFPLEIKNGRVKEDTKCLMIQCHSPNVLTEMPVLTNGLSNTACGNDDDFEQDCGNGVHTRIQKAFSSLVKAKFAHVKKVTPFSPVTPCSIAVGADERAACERFSFQRNGFCRALRTSRVIYNGRSRNDSTGNGDSDESLENMSESSFGHSESPQDGNRKRPLVTARKNDCRKPAVNSVSSASEVSEGKSKPAEPVTSGSNGCVSYNNEAVSDDDTCYYEGVDSSDIFINNCSSDESIASNGELKQKTSATDASDKANESQGSVQISCNADDDQNEKQEGESNDKESGESSILQFDKKHASSPTASSAQPSKRLRTSPGQKAKEKETLLNVSRSFNTRFNENSTSVIDLTCESMGQQSTTLSHKSERASSSSMRNTREHDRVSNKFRPLILGHSRTAGKNPIVILEKSIRDVADSPVLKEEKAEHIDQMESSIPQETCSLSAAAVCVENLSAHNDFESKLKLENEDLSITFHDPEYGHVLKADIENNDEMNTDNAASGTPVVLSNKQRRRPPKRKSVKSKHKTMVVEKINRDAEVKDSFKSMKFSRTLDLMKARRKREQTSIGPFVRVVGKQSTPDSVTVFTQPIHESFVGVNAGKHKHSKNKHVHPQSVSTAIHMMTSISADKEAMVSSARTISNTPWVCAFCAQQSSYRFLGDLFGPYFKENDIQRVESIAAEESKKGDTVKEQKQLDTTIRRSKDSVLPERKSYRKGKSLPQSKPSRANSPPPEEVWVHEACAIWSPGVYMIGNKIYGLDEAIKDAADTVCSACKTKGAMIGCLHKGCTMKHHYVCAIGKDCFMDEEKLSLLCRKHKGKKIQSTADCDRS